MSPSLKAEACAKRIKLVVFDVDGVLTNGCILIGETGELVKSFFARDGLGIRLVQRAGIHTAIISGRVSPQVVVRAKELNIGKVYQGCLDKRKAFAELCHFYSVSPEEVSYIGDDLIDLPIMKQVGFPACVSDAVLEVKEHSLFVSSFSGGNGAIREILEFILKAKGLWDDVVQSFLKPPDNDYGEELSQ